MVPRDKTDKLGQMAEKALKEAVKGALEQHRRMKVPAVYMRNGRIVYLMPDGRVVNKPNDRKSAKK
ncbi:hypothetical protein A2625_05500 [candidate division WOR-1 bacterium RIFCSPHIGHO2_01_FULL_53_15]|uniref:Uncharacterized protein n=1 Tax=candidate division WOR-1 bacterium RIFCSPHIGHO2_01_FULL_53_15 TaxID=1802564 RepID=A0A1F4Q1T4_UNCSA|nr:MAG: hypothetical protein A2625_05500 [candidate division WOR-1 bacterium RIFCSPHIGHO2_01_FULL_53_15]OGC13122.1 MAG: hypothetical protein A3D23_00445 [candidate division WOR-1 bacterium RIFCSPHIGHO2_02_FULL_53_26]